jgi:hypothetical protein
LREIEREETKIQLTVEQLKLLLDEQKKITIERCLSHNYVYNKESTDGNYMALPIDEEKFTTHGLKADYPSDFNVLIKYLR